MIDMSIDSSEVDETPTKKVFNLNVLVPDQSARKVVVRDHLIAGLDPRNDLILVDPVVRAKHMLFSKKGNHLSLHYLGRDGEASLNEVPLEQGKLYLLQTNDIISTGEISIEVEGTSEYQQAEDDFLAETISSDEELNSNEEESEEDGPRFEYDPNAKMSNKNFNKPPPADVSSEDGEEKNKPKALSFKLNSKAIKSKFNKQQLRINPRGFSQIPYKVWGFLLDVSITYFLMVFLIPILGLQPLVREYFTPISEYLIHNIITHGDFAHFNILSTIEFMIVFHLVMITSSLLLGTTPGAFFIGLHPKSLSNFLVIRIRAYFYALLNIVFLPLLILDIPLIDGRTLKEVITFSEREVNYGKVAKVFRRSISPLFIIGVLISPTFLPLPYTSTFYENMSKVEKNKDPHASLISSQSSEFGIKINTELQSDFILLPFFEDNKIGLTLHSIKHNKTLKMIEEKRIEYSDLLFSMRYGNPFASIQIPDTNINAIDTKDFFLDLIYFSPTDLFDNAMAYGPFMANGYLLKEEILKTFPHGDQFFIEPYIFQNPFVKISHSQTDKVFFFAKKELIIFNVQAPKESNLINILNYQILTPAVSTKYAKSNKKTPQIFEAIESFELNNYQSLLTYYTEEAKRFSQSDNPQIKLFVKKNIEQTKKALISNKKKKNIPGKLENSFNEISGMLDKSKEANENPGPS